MDKDTRKTTFDQLFEPIFSRKILGLATEELEARAQDTVWGRVWVGYL